MLGQVNKLRKAKKMAPAIDMQIENALMMVKPSSKTSNKPKKIKSDIEEYIKFLLFEQLSEKNLDEIAGKLLT